MPENLIPQVVEKTSCLPVNLIPQVVETVIYCALGVIVFGISFFIMNKITPFSIRKEIEEDQNTSLGIIIAGVIVGLSIIIAAAIK